LGCVPSRTKLPAAAFHPKVDRAVVSLLRKTGWGYVSAIDSNWRTIWIADAHRDDGKRFVVRVDELLTAFLELETAIRINSIDTVVRRCQSRPRVKSRLGVPPGVLLTFFPQG